VTTTVFDLHGLVRLDLVDAPPAAISAVTADTGLLPAMATAGAADITAEFSDDLGLSGPLRRVGRDAGFTGDRFVLGREPGRRVAISFDGDRTRLSCEPEVAHLPHLVSLLNLAMLRRGALPLHGSAVVHGGRGIVATGWSKGGKTELVLGLMAAGATFVADEWCYLLPDQRVVLGLRHPVRVWDWQLMQLPALQATLTGRQRVRLATSRRLTGVPRLGPALEPTLGVSAPPEQLFGADRIAARCDLDLLVLVEARDNEGITAEPVQGAEVAARMAASLQAERADLTADLLRHRFALPDAPAPDLSDLAHREGQLLRDAFGNVPSLLVSHPYPVDLASLARAVADLR
jgi:hypothetical protein